MVSGEGVRAGARVGAGAGAGARTSAAPLCTRTVRRVSPVLTLPSKPSIPTAPPYLTRTRGGGLGKG